MRRYERVWVNTSLHSIARITSVIHRLQRASMCSKEWHERGCLEGPKSFRQETATKETYDRVENPMKCPGKDPAAIVANRNC